MKKSVIVALLFGLLAGATVGVSAEAAKKKKKKAKWVQSELTFFLRWDGDATSCGANFLSLEDAEDAGSGCEFIEQPLQEVYVATGGAVRPKLERLWPAADGIPFVLDATRPITGEITMRGTAMANARVEVRLDGTVKDDPTAIGEGESQTFNSGPTAATGPAIAQFEIEPDAALNKKVFDTLSLTTATRGVTVFSYMDLEDPPSFFVVPVWVKKK